MMKKVSLVLALLFICSSFAIAAPQKVTIIKKAEKIEYDTAGGGVEYFGWALPNTATSVSRWKMMRITTISDDFVVEWADGNSNYDNEWDERAAATYL